MFVKRKATKQSMSFRKPIYGFGINDADYMVTYKDGGKLFRCEIYKTWSNMLKRCYCEKDIMHNPAYRDCSVCDEWLTFSNFYKWMVRQEWAGLQLDKDFIESGNKIYSPSTCVFVDSRINSLFAKSSTAKGFRFNKKSKKFEARCRVKGECVHLGTFSSEKEAKSAYISFKVKHVIGLAREHKKPICKIILNKLRGFVLSQQNLGI